MGKTIVTLLANWRLDVVGGRTYGVCSVDVSEPLTQLSFKKGFPLVSPTSQRCAIYSVRLALEIALHDNEVRADETMFYTIVVRSENVYNMLFKDGPESDKARTWVADIDNGGRKNRSVLRMCGYNKSFIMGILAMTDYLREQKLGDVVFAPLEETGDILTKKIVNLDVDPEKDLNGEKDEDQSEETIKMRMDNIKRKDALRKELLEASVTGSIRGSRKGRNLTKKERKNILVSETR